MTIHELLHLYQCWIVRALDTGDADRLRQAIAVRNELMDRLRINDEGAEEGRDAA